MDILSFEEELRYNRQIILKQFDFQGQEALKQSSILVIGLGGLGCAATQYLSVSGIGHLTLIDDDKVELSNLARQVLHNDERIARLKVESAADTLAQLNPYLTIKTIAQRLDDKALSSLIKQHTLILDCSDNITTRNQLNRLCFKYKKPLVSGAAIRLEGQISVFTYTEKEPCYQCISDLFGPQNLSCVETGILSPIVGIIGAMQALEAIKIISQFAVPPIGKLMLFDACISDWKTFFIPKNLKCPICATLATHNQ